MGQYIVNAAIYIQADTYEDFQLALRERDWDDLEIMHITEPEDKWCQDI